MKRGGEGPRHSQPAAGVTRDSNTARLLWPRRVAGAVDEEVKLVYRAPGATLTMPLVCAVGPDGTVTMSAKAKGGTSCNV